jgi:SHS2 domain-containing protein
LPDNRFVGRFEFVPHTADIAARVSGRTVADVFRAAAHAFTDALTDRTGVEPVTERRVALAAPDLEQLLVDWLEELLYLFETHRFLLHDADVNVRAHVHSGQPADALRDLRDEYVIAATLRGESRDPSRHPLKLLIKAVTYHGLHVTQTEQGYEVTVIFDI